jgi:TetR/AcrR family transcriptional regulator, fatty acid metabolism regulator protein
MASTADARARSRARTRARRGGEPSSLQGRPRAGERAAQILAAARALFSERGYEQASMAEIAARVGVVEGALYRHYASKRELLFAVMRTFYRSLIDSLREGLGGVAGARNRLRYVIWSQLRAFTEETGLCRVVISEIRPLDDYGQSLVRELNRELTGVALGVIDEAVRAGELRGDLPRQMVRDVIYGGIEHLAWTAVIGNKKLDVERTADALTELIYAGLGARAPAAAAADRLEAQVDRLQTMLERAGS